MQQVGIEKIGFYIPQFYVDLNDIAKETGIDPEKYHKGIGQECFAMPSPDEDVVTMASSAAQRILNDTDKVAIDTVMVATESGIDQSKSSAVYVHALLGLSPNCRALELKQACYSATAGLRLAASYVAMYPDKKVLLIASDFARYERNTPAEATQGAGAVAMLISAQPKVAVIQPHFGLYTESVMDFWRPNDCATPLVDGKLSTRIYLRAAQEAWRHYQAQTGASFADFTAYCYHLPFSKMAIKTHQQLCRDNGQDFCEESIASGMIYNRVIGNTYTAALYLALCSTLDHRDDLENKHIAMMSYGSGSVAEYFAFTLQKDYQQALFSQQHQQMLATRERLSFADYEDFWHCRDEGSSSDVLIAHYSAGDFRFAGIEAGKRIYQSCL